MFDKAICILGLVALLPVQALIAVAVLADSGRPVLFRQIRVGRLGQPFHLLKFRTMRVASNGLAITFEGDDRITRVGRVLRKFKLDELPQLWNVVRGDMALVGPRPEVPEFVDDQVPIWRCVLSVPPGITDLATLTFCHEEQLLAQTPDPLRHYREVVLPTKLALNVAYLQQRNFWRDLKLILLTIRYTAFRGDFDPGRILKG